MDARSRTVGMSLTKIAAFRFSRLRSFFKLVRTVGIVYLRLFDYLVPEVSTPATRRLRCFCERFERKTRKFVIEGENPSQSRRRIERWRMKLIDVSRDAWPFVLNDQINEKEYCSTLEIRANYVSAEIWSNLLCKFIRPLYTPTGNDCSAIGSVWTRKRRMHYWSVLCTFVYT